MVWSGRWPALSHKHCRQKHQERGCGSPVMPVRMLMAVNPMEALLTRVKFLRSSCL